MGHYTNLTLSEVQDILNFYSLGEVKELSPLSYGISNSNFKVLVIKNNISKPFLLKISNDKNKSELSGEQEILHCLEKAGFPLSISPLKTQKDTTIFSYKEYIGVIYPFVEGITPKPEKETCYQIGKALGKLHSLKKESFSNDKIRKHETIGFELPFISNFVHSKDCPSQFKEYFWDIFPKGIESLINESFEEGIMHGDLYYDNTLFKDKALITLLDFEQAGLGPLILDLGISISGTSLSNGKVSLSLIEKFIEGYEKERPLSQLERASLNSFILLGLFSISLWRIYRFKFGELDSKKADSYLELLERASNFKNELL
ncbi:MAG: hypothetical protein CME68_03035 [Halobacteriovoraceae bacterium]|nr:hypothetical protein [Halobacteriovoraceae bacterium]|tara:strand:- start:420 stop:1370 length:951 start_codon:yes stop_codon:yes gene_type:complete